MLIATGILGFFPLLGGPGYESSLAVGLFVPSIAAISTALRCSRTPIKPFQALLLGANHGIGLASLALGITLLHGLRVGFCSFWDGLELFLLGPWCGTLMGAGWGAIVGWSVGYISTPKRRVFTAILLALAGPITSALISGLRFWTSPMVFAFDPFVGFFSGTLYDTVIDGTDRLRSYRLGSLATWGAALGIAAHGPTLRWRGWLSALSLLALACSLGVTWRGPSLGHYQTTASIREELGGSLQGPFCEILYSSSIRSQDAELFLRDCEQQLATVSSFLKLERRPVTAFLFADSSQKRRLMGAADTYIAKPWRREVYLQVAGYPHPVLGHELAHVVAGQTARGPFHVAGAWQGVFPDPGLIEGLAVAASPEEDALSPEGWSRAMLELKLLPPLSSLFSLGFYGYNSGKAYTVAGAFVGWVHERFGAEVLQRWYAGGSLPALVGQDWPTLEQEFHRSLRALPLPDGALAVARARFDRPSVFQRRCPHEVDASKQEAAFLLGAFEVVRATQLLDRVETLAPRDPGTILLRASCAERAAQPEQAISLLEKLVQSSDTPKIFQDRAEERLADLALQSGNLEQAAQRYERLHQRILDEDQLRSLEIKQMATQVPEARPAVIALLIGDPGRTPDLAIAAEELARWAERSPEDGTPLYLLGRNALLRGFSERAAMQLDLALQRTISLPRVAREAARQRVIAGCILRDSEGVTRGLAAWNEVGAPLGNRGTLLQALASRCIAP